MEKTDAITVVELIDRLPLTGRQYGILLLCSGVALLDGADTLSIGAAAPLMAEAMGLKVMSFGPVFSAGLLGAAVGAMIFGQLADRLGRKRLLVIATILFGVFTFFTAHAASMTTLIAVRFCAGFGLGGATPCFIAMASEYTPARIRSAVVTALWAVFPLGGMLGSFLSSYLIASVGWPAIFYVGGILPLVLALVICMAMPESIQFLATRGGAVEEIRALLAKIWSSSPRERPEWLIGGANPMGNPVRQLFTSGRAAATLILWVRFFAAFGTLAVVSFWTPALLYQRGVSAATGAVVLACHALGGVLGMASSGYLIQRLGARSVLFVAFAIGAACAAALGYAMPSVATTTLLMALIGIFVGIAGSGTIALAAAAYPTAMRTTGVGWALATGRFGQVLGPLAIGALLQNGWGAQGAMAVVAIVSLLGAIATVATGNAAGSH